MSIPLSPHRLLQAAADLAEARAQHWAARVRVFRLAATRLAHDGIEPSPGELEAARRTLGWPMPTQVTRTAPGTDTERGMDHVGHEGPLPPPTSPPDARRTLPGTPGTPERSDGLSGRPPGESGGAA